MHDARLGSADTGNEKRSVIAIFFLGEVEDE